MSGGASSHGSFLKLVKDFWAIAVALPHELGGILPLCEVEAQLEYRGMKMIEARLGGQEIFIAVTGIGPERAARAARYLIDNYPVTRLLSTGYCGGLQAGIENGAAIVADRVVLAETPEKMLPVDVPLLRRAEQSLASAGIPYHLGTLVTVAKPVLKNSEKERLVAQIPAAAVDMESGALLEGLGNSEKKIASVTVRFIVDALGDELSDTETFLDENAAVKPLSLVREMIRRPKLMAELPGLGRKAGRARSQLTQFVSCFFNIHSKEPEK